MVFRIGDFSLDGYPDLIALIRETSQNPMIFENVPCNDCISNATRLTFPVFHFFIYFMFIIFIFQYFYQFYLMDLIQYYIIIYFI